MSISCPMCPNMIRCPINLSSHLRTHSFVPRRRTTPRMTRQAGHDRGTWLCIMRSVLFTKKHNLKKYWQTGHSSIMEPHELEMYPCLLCAAKFRSRKELEKQGRAGHFRERAIPCSLVERPSIPIRTCPTMSRQSTESC